MNARSVIDRVGFVLGSGFHPTDLISVARAVEHHGYGRIWATEDYFATGGFTGAAAILGATDRIEVGTGVLSVYARHPALVAMEAATLASVFPHRFTLGLGVGGSGWLSQQGIAHNRPLKAVRDSVDVVRRLLRGEQVTGEFGHFTTDHVALDFPPPTPPRIYIGATGPKMTALTAEISDGLVLSVFSTPEFVEIERNIVTSTFSPDGPVALSTFTFLALADSAQHARARARPVLSTYLAHSEGSVMTDAIGITDGLREIAAAGGAELLEREMPDRWIDQLCVCGDPITARNRILELLDAGSDDIALAPIDNFSLMPSIAALGSALR